MNNTYQLEICANSVTSAARAQEGGADRVELCQNLDIGGTTPSMGQIMAARSILSIGLHVLIRPRGGDFLYSETEFTEMKLDILACRERKCDGVVVGMLQADGRVDVARMKELVEMAGPMQITFHRAFDCCRDPFEALETIIGLGCDRLLTSGMKETAEAGAETIAKLVEQAAGRITVMAGAGIHEDNLERIAEVTGATAFHTSAKVRQVSNMNDADSAVGGMGDAVWVSSKEKIRRMADLIKTL